MRIIIIGCGHTGAGLARELSLAGHAVTVVPGDSMNIKITTKSDLTLAGAILKARPARTVPRMGAFEEAQW